MFRSMILESWRQFDKVSINFHQQLTVLTGANGTGKTTILNVLSRHFDWPATFLGTPYRAVADGALKYRTGLHVGSLELEGTASASIGRLVYTTGTEAILQVPIEAGPSFDVQIVNQQPLSGLSIPSHRSIAGYQAVPSIPTVFSTTDQILAAYISDLRQRYFGTGGRNALFSMKENLIAAAVFGEGNESVEPNQEARELFDGFGATLQSLMPQSLGFERLLVRSPDVMVETASGTFPIDALSGGLSAIIEVGWQIYLRSRLSSNFIVVIDEPENHLHPSLQRAFMPSLLAAFPDIQFIVATHSPFIVGAIPQSNVYVLHYGEDRRVKAVLLDRANKAGTTNEILREVLGLDSTMPIWAESELDRIVREFSQAEMTVEAFDQLRERLRTIGLENAAPETIRRVFERGADDAPAE